MDTVTQRTIVRFEKAVRSLEAALALPRLPEHAERDAALLRFEFAAELMPKCLRRILSERGADVTLPKDIVRAAYTADFIDERGTSSLLAAIDDRNRMVHDYSEKFAHELHARIRGKYISALRQLLENIRP